MSDDKRLVHVSVSDDPSQAQLSDIRDVVQDALRERDSDMGGVLVVSSDRMELSETDLDTLADKVAERLEGDE